MIKQLLVLLLVTMVSTSRYQSNINKNFVDYLANYMSQNQIDPIRLGAVYCPPTQSSLYCAGTQTCCKTSTGYGCCIYTSAVCCSDGTCVKSGGIC